MLSYSNDPNFHCLDNRDHNNSPKKQQAYTNNQFTINQGSWYASTQHQPQETIHYSPDPQTQHEQQETIRYGYPLSIHWKYPSPIPAPITSPTQTPSTEPEGDRLAKKRDRNRVSAAKLREKKKYMQVYLEENYKNLKKHCDMLEQRKTHLERVNQYLIGLLNNDLIHKE